MKRIFTFLPAILLSIQLSAWDYLSITDVNSWWQEPGSIENIYLTVSPKGIYAECELIIDFSAENQPFTIEDSLEVEMWFDLPENSVVTDLWLWIFGQAEQAKIYDRWTASLIYESIVQRRIDPAILTKDWGDSYNLKVFPIMLNMPRRIKIKYLTPINNSFLGLSTVPIPLNIIKLSMERPEIVNIYFEENEAFNSPSIIELPEKEFSKIVHPESSFKDGVRIAGLTDNLNNLNLAFKNKKNCIQACVFEDKTKENNYYQLNLVPEQLFNINASKKAVFLLDFIDENSSTINGEELFQGLKESILNNFSEKDSINLMFSGMLTAKASDEWIGCDPITINKLFSSLSAEFFNSYSNLPPLLNDGIEFLKMNGLEGTLVLISSGNENGSNDEANDLVTDVLDLIGSDNITIHTINLDDLYYDYNDRHYIGGNYYSGNEYLYNHLAQNTSGETLSIRDLSLVSMLQKTSTRLSGYFKNLVIQVEFTDGYAYSTYNLTSTNNIVYYDSPYQQIGMYIGDLPLTIKSYAQLSTGEVIQNQTVITENNLLPNDSSLSKVWATQYIEELKTMDYSNLITNSIIETSIEERVLCEYTAFLVLEPGFVPDIDPDNPNNIEEDWMMSTSVQEIASTENNLTNYPNPFSTSTLIKYDILKAGHVQLKIIDLQGREFEILTNQYQENGTYSIQFNGSSLNEGIYYCCLWIDNKLIKQSKMVIIR